MGLAKEANVLCKILNTTALKYTPSYATEHPQRVFRDPKIASAPRYIRADVLAIGRGGFPEQSAKQSSISFCRGLCVV